MENITGVKLPTSLAGDGDQAVEYLERYYGQRLDPESEKTFYDGAYFDHWGAKDPNPNEFTADDIVAVECLGMPIRTWSAVVEILHLRSARLSELLAQVPADLDLLSVPVGDINDEWPASQLYWQLRAIPGIGEVSASKLLARKRPNLYPIHDSFIRAITGLGSGAFVRPFLEELSANTELQEQLQRVRSRADLEGKIGLLRTFDVVGWMEYGD